MNKPHILALDQKENAKHGETLFPMQKYITRLAADYPVVSMHWHEEAELTLITKGDCTYQIDFVTYEAKKVISYLSRHFCCIPFHAEPATNFSLKPMYFI